VVRRLDESVGNRFKGHARAREPEKPVVLFLEQQSWRSGAERVLDEVLCAIEPEFTPIVAFPADGPFQAELLHRHIETLLFPLGHYRSGPKSVTDVLEFGPRSLYCAFRLSQIIRERNVALVYINSPRCLPAGIVAARLTARPSLFHLHMTMTRWADLWLATRTARYSTRIVACSQTSATALCQADFKLSAMTQVIYNPVRKLTAMGNLRVPCTTLTPSLARFPRFLLGQVGRITLQKGQHVLLKAAARLKSLGTDVHIVFVGAPEENNPEDAAYTRYLDSLASDLGLEGKVHWTGYQNDPTAFYAIFDALVIPSTVSEGLPMVALEALQWGLPVIGSRLGGIPEIVHDDTNGFLVPPGDERALADTLQRLLSSPAVRTRLQAGARASIDDRFSVDSFQNRIRLIISELCRLTTLGSQDPHLLSLLERDQITSKVKNHTVKVPHEV
jgi:glycosyltransferase involved in cell wall biosynthesis